MAQGFRRPRATRASRTNTILAAALITVAGPNAAPSAADEIDRETDPAVLAKLKRWRDLKFGLLLHWGPYCQWGIVESWSICAEDVPWCARPIPDYDEYLRRYEALPETFDPSAYDPAQWARSAADAGMRYVVVTTKHHDGFCMFDTAQTDYRITHPDCPFSVHQHSNVTRALFEAFRTEDLWTGVYFSKPDWHHPDFWAPEWPHPDRNVNYDPERYPERWQRFCDFTFRQIEELMTGYGPVDVLWLDGGWIRPENTLTEESREWLGPRQFVQDIDMPRIATMAREHQPGLLIVDRTVHGRYENYRTPEQRIPDAPIAEAWETCLTMARSWSYVPDDVYKPTRELIHTLVDVVAKGGNLLLNVGPGPDGRLPPTALERMAEIGAWIEVNGESIYSTRSMDPALETKMRYTRGKDGAVYATYLPDPGEPRPPSRWLLHRVRPANGAEVRLLGTTTPLPWRPVGTGCWIELPDELVTEPPCDHAWVLRISAVAE